jgi:H+/Cl- antiporter ClcA
LPADDPTPRNIAQAITEVSEKASLLVREEIELAKAEVTARVTKLAKGAVVAIICGVFFLFALIYLLQSLAWGVWEVTGWQSGYWFGFLVVALLLILLGALGGVFAYKAMKAGSPPVPEMAIDEAKKIKETVAGDAASSPVVPPTVRGVS